MADAQNQKQVSSSQRLQRIWAQEDRVPANWGHYAELSFEEIYQQLLENGFIEDDHPWRNIGPWLVKRAIAELKGKNGGDISADSADFDVPVLEANYFP